MDGRAIEAEIPHLRRYARALLSGHREAADDLVQDTLERAWSKRHLLHPGGRLRGWLFRILYRRFLDLRRSPQPAHRKLICLDEVWAEVPHTKSRQEASMYCRDVLLAIDRLAAQQRAILLLVALEQPSYREGARMLGIKVGTFRSRLSRAREQLDAELGATQAESDRRNSDERTTLRRSRL